MTIARRGMLGAGSAVLLAMLAPSAAAQQDPVGPCSPYRAADGDIASELPGCARRLRPAPGSLADELGYRGARGNAEADDDAAAPAPGRKRTRRPRSE